MHLTLANQLRIKVLDEDSWTEEADFIVQSCAWALRTTVPANVPHAPGTLAYGMDMIYRQQIKIDWEFLKRKRVKQHIANNLKENRNRREHKYKEGDLVLIVMLPYERGKKPKISKFAEGPYKVLKVFSNGTLRILRGSYEENISIRRVRPYYKRG